VDLKEEQTTGFHLASYRDNDQSYSAEILGETGPGDLVVRDLGYFSLPTLQALDDQDSLFLSRLRYGVVIKDPNTGARIDLFGSGGLLKERETVDMMVQIGEETPVTVLASRCQRRWPTSGGGRPRKIVTQTPTTARTTCAGSAGTSL
jgi:hypothetical protein